jgi:hypothetical protein
VCHTGETRKEGTPSLIARLLEALEAERGSETHHAKEELLCAHIFAVDP